MKMTSLAPRGIDAIFLSNEGADRAHWKRAKSQKPKAKSQKPKAKSQKPKAKSQKPTNTS
jgi:hypothetical protein